MWNIIFKAVVAIIILVLIAFNAELYIFCRQEKAGLDSIRAKQDVESEFNSNKFKYLQGQIEDYAQGLQDVHRQINAQQDESKDIETDLVGIKAEADAVKQQGQGWQKDYVSVLAQLEKKLNGARDEIKSLEKSVAALKVSNPPAESPSSTAPQTTAP